MDDLHRLEAKGLARAKIRSQRRRVATIRRRTIRGSLALFAIFWAVIFGQLVAGSDPALSRKSGREQLAATGAARTSSTRGSTEASPATAPPEPQPESELEAELERERGFEPEPEESFESTPEAEFEPEPSAPIVTSAS